MSVTRPKVYMTEASFYQEVKMPCFGLNISIMKYLHKMLRKGEQKFLGLRPTRRRLFIFLLLSHFILAITSWEVAQMITHKQALRELQQSQQQLQQEIRSIARYAVELELGYLQNKKPGLQQAANQARY